MFATEGIYPKSHLLNDGDLKMFCGIEKPLSKTGYSLVDTYELSKDDEALLLKLGVNGVECCKRCARVAIAHLTKHAPDVVESAASSEIPNASEVSASEADSTPATTQVM